MIHGVLNGMSECLESYYVLCPVFCAICIEANASSTLKKRESCALEMDRSFDLSFAEKRLTDFLKEKTNMDCNNSLD